MVHVGLVVASTLVGSALALPPPTQVEKRETGVVVNPPAATTINNSAGVGKGKNVYKAYSGNGTPADGWPSIDDWVSFDDMFNDLKPELRESCSQYGVPNNSDEEIGRLYNGIQEVAKDSKVDHRYILAEIMKESTGCVRAPTTGSIPNPGLLQDHAGSASCNRDGKVTTPCPQSTITAMIRQGVQGTPSGAGLAQLINAAQDDGARGAQAFYYASEWYNRGQGTPPFGDNISGPNDYASKVANFLTGWLNN